MKYFAGFLYGISSYYVMVLQLLSAIYLSNRYNFQEYVLIFLKFVLFVLVLNEKYILLISTIYCPLFSICNV